VVRPIVGSGAPCGSVNSSPIGRHFERSGTHCVARVAGVKKRLSFVYPSWLLWAALGAGHACAQSGSVPATGPEWSGAAERFASQTAKAAIGTRKDVRLEIVPGTLDPRLRLAPCQRIDAYLPPGQPPWGRTRVGLRCVEGAVAWNVFLPVTVKVFAPALVATQPLAAGTVLQPGHLRLAEADWAASDSPTVVLAELALGRTLSRMLPAGSALRDADLKRRQWFAVGDPVRIVASGPGFAVSGEGLALTPGIEGRPARVRTETGRTLTGVAAGERRVEVAL
jgi:flagellar basal body P-ring formation protein FlgA